MAARAERRDVPEQQNIFSFRVFLDSEVPFCTPSTRPESMAQKENTAPMRGLFRSFSSSDLSGLEAKMNGDATFSPKMYVPRDVNKIAGEGQCAVCLGEQIVEPVVLACSHVFCAGCLEKAAATQTLKSSCPLCRKGTILDPNQVSQQKQTVR